MTEFVDVEKETVTEISDTEDLVEDDVIIEIPFKPQPEIGNYVNFLWFISKDFSTSWSFGKL